MMKESGEVVGSGGVSEATGWEEVEALASQAPDESQEQEDGNSDNLSEVENENSERLRQLNEAVFEKVDRIAALERTMKFDEKIDVDKLSELRIDLQRDPKMGMFYAQSYFAEVLGLSVEPHLRMNVNLGEGVLGDCGSGDEYGDRIRVDLTSCNGDMDRALAILAHENWHSYQNDVMRRVRNGEAVSEETKELAELYEYNNKSYIKANLDYAGYRGQLLEVEARAFEFLVGAKIIKIKVKEQQEAAFITEHAEVYGEENLLGIEKEVDGVLHGMDVEEFVRKAGVNSLDELFDMGEKVIRGYVGAVAELVGLKNQPEIEFMEKMEKSEEIRMDYANNRIQVNLKQGDDPSIWALNKVIWECRQRERALHEPEDERSKLYRLNFGYFLKADKNREGYKRQLLVREQEMFARDLMDILDEQWTEEYVAMLPLEKQAEAEKERAEKNWRPVVSEKYEVRSKYAREN